MTASAIVLPVIFSMPWFVSSWALAGSLLTRSLAVDVAGEQRLDDVRVRLEVVGPDDQVGRDVLALRPQGPLVDEDLAAALLDEARRPWLGHPGAVDLAARERLERLGVLLGQDRDVAAALRVGREAVVREPRPEGDVLGVAELRRRELLARARSAAEVDLRLDDEERAARRRAGDDPDRRALRLGEGVDRRVRADVGRVDGAVEQRLGRRRRRR